MRKLVFYLYFVIGLVASNSSGIDICSVKGGVTSIRNNKDFLGGAWFDSAEDTIAYDDGTSAWAYHSATSVYWGVRFTPTSACTVKAGVVETWVESGLSPLCSLFVFSDDGGKPDTVVAGPVAFTPRDTMWDTVNFSTPYYTGTSDFWIVYWLPLPLPMGTDSTYILADTTYNYPGRDAGSSNRLAWDVYGAGGIKGDFLIRAVVNGTGGDTTLSYDDGSWGWIYYMKPSLYWAVKFTHAYPCTLAAGLVAIEIRTGTPPICSLLVWQDASGAPGDLVAGPVAFPTNAGAQGYRVNLTAEYIATTDFWIGYWLPISVEPDTFYALADASYDYPGRDAISADRSSWRVYQAGQLSGDFLIRAILKKPPTSIEENSEFRVQNSGLQVYPSPFSTTTEIKLSGYQATKSNNPIARLLDSSVALEIYDLSGRLIRTFNHLTTDQLTSVVWDGTDNFGKPVQNGIYFVKIQNPNDECRIVRKVVLIR